MGLVRFVRLFWNIRLVDGSVCRLARCEACRWYFQVSGVSGQWIGQDAEWQVLNCFDALILYFELYSMQGKPHWDSLTFSPPPEKITQEIAISQHYWISANICQWLLLPRALPLRFAAAMVKTGWEQPRPERVSPQTSSAANRSWDLQPGMPLRLSTVKC